MKLAKYLIGITAITLAAAAQGVPLLQEGFDNLSTLAGSGWVRTNNSAPVGSTGWFQGNAGVFMSQAGAPNSYIAANFNNAVDGGVIDNWLISPELSLLGGASLTFFTRTADLGFADMLEILFSASGSAVSSFTTSLLTVGPGTPYPTNWVEFTVVLPSVTSGRFAFHYSVPNSFDADSIGIDTVSVETPTVPEPSTYALLALGLAGLALIRRRQRAV